MNSQKEPTWITENKPFPVRLRELMDTTGTTQAALGNAVGVTRQTISLYANGQNTPDIETFTKIADFFGVSFDYLLGRSEAKEREYHSATETTGLSEKAIKRLEAWNELINAEISKGARGSMVENRKAPEELSRIIESKHLYSLINYIRSLKHLSGQNYGGIESSILGPAKANLLKKEIGINATREYVMFLTINTFRDIVNEIVPFTPIVDEARQATQADIDDALG